MESEGKESLGQLAQVQPPERGVLEGAVVEIETVYVEVRDQAPPPTKTETASEGGLNPTVESIGVVAKRYHRQPRLSSLNADALSGRRRRPFSATFIGRSNATVTLALVPGAVPMPVGRSVHACRVAPVLGCVPDHQGQETA